MRQFIDPPPLSEPTDLSLEEINELERWERYLRNLDGADPLLALQREEALYAIRATRAGDAVVSEAEISALMAFFSGTDWPHAPARENVELYRRTAAALRRRAFN